MPRDLSTVLASLDVTWLIEMLRQNICGIDNGDVVEIKTMKDLNLFPWNGKQREENSVTRWDGSVYRKIGTERPAQRFNSIFCFDGRNQSIRLVGFAIVHKECNVWRRTNPRLCNPDCKAQITS